MNVQPRNWWAIGWLDRYGDSPTLNIRRIVTGRDAARGERKIGETIRRVTVLMVDTKAADFKGREPS